MFQNEGSSLHKQEGNLAQAQHKRGLFFCVSILIILVAAAVLWHLTVLLDNVWLYEKMRVHCHLRSVIPCPLHMENAATCCDLPSSRKDSHACLSHSPTQRVCAGTLYVRRRASIIESQKDVLSSRGASLSPFFPPPGPILRRWAHKGKGKNYLLPCGLLMNSTVYSKVRTLYVQKRWWIYPTERKMLLFLAIFRYCGSSSPPRGGAFFPVSVVGFFFFYFSPPTKEASYHKTVDNIWCWANYREEGEAKSSFRSIIGYRTSQIEYSGPSWCNSIHSCVVTK